MLDMNDFSITNNAESSEVTVHTISYPNLKICSFKETN